VTDAIEKIIDGYAAIDRTLSGIGRSDEQHIAAARAELAALRARVEAAEEVRNDMPEQAFTRTEEAYTDLLNMVAAQARQIAALGAALDEAATSLDTLARSGARDAAIQDFSDVRGFANSRARVAHEALSSVPPSSMPSLQKDPVTGRNDYVVPPPLSEGALDEIRANLGIVPSSMRCVPVDPFGPVIDLYEKHRQTWADEDEWYWLTRLQEEAGELASAICGRGSDPIDLELREIASIALNWLRRRAAALAGKETK